MSEVSSGSAPSVFIIPELTPYLGYIIFMKERKEQWPTSQRLFQLFWIITYIPSTHMSLAKASHVTKFEVKEIGVSASSIERHLKSHDNGQEWIIGKK